VTVAITVVLVLIAVTYWPIALWVNYQQNCELDGEEEL
jgi:hypothetical protein